MGLSVCIRRSGQYAEYPVRWVLSTLSTQYVEFPIRWVSILALVCSHTLSEHNSVSTQWQGAMCENNKPLVTVARSLPLWWEQLLLCYFLVSDFSFFCCIFYFRFQFLFESLTLLSPFSLWSPLSLISTAAICLIRTTWTHTDSDGLTFWRQEKWKAWNIRKSLHEMVWFLSF